MPGGERQLTEREPAGMSEPPSWDERYSADEKIWSGNPNAQLVTTHFLHPPDGAMVEVTRRLAEALARGGHLLVVGHAPSEAFTHLTAGHRRAMFLADQLLTGLPDDFEALVVEQRPPTVTRDGMTVDVHDSTLLARRQV
jgi:hypothetical protein